MRGHHPKSEAAFFDTFAAYNDLERSSSRKYASGEYSLERMVPLADAAGNPERRLRIIHVAGTKGKGSTCHFSSAVIASTGRRCGMFTSPHVATVRERFQIDNRMIDYERLLPAAAALEAEVRSRGLHPSLFEIMTVLALRLFADSGCEWAILETGIGGRLDATNYVSCPACCGISAVSLDHVQVLGATIVEIASEKAGIIKPGVPVVCGRQPAPEAEAIIRRRAAELGSPCHAPVPFRVVAPFFPRGTPDFQLENAALAWRICQCCGMEPRQGAFVPPEIRARCEKVSEDPLVILDGAHNADSAGRLAHCLSRLHPHTRFTIVLGIVEGKDVEGILRRLQLLEADYILTNPHSPKPSALNQLRRVAREKGLDFTVISEITSREQLPDAAAYLFTGSFFTAVIGEKLFSESPQAGMEGNGTSGTTTETGAPLT